MVLTETSSDLKKQLKATSRLIGHTPLVRLSRVFHKPGVKLYAKLEWHQLGGSVKARAAFRIISDALTSGAWHPGQRLLDATSGNTGIAYAAICARLGLPLTICLPENASPERKRLLTAYGAELIYTSRMEGTDGAQAMARELVEAHPGAYFYADQYNNDSNWKAHFDTTGPEVMAQTKGKITHFAAGLGTTGTFVGTSRFFAAYHPKVQVTALKPDSALHGLEGWKDLETARVPGIYDPALARHEIAVSTPEAYEMMVRAAKEEGILLSPSSAANLAGAIRLAESLEKGVVVTVFPDDASKYQDLINQLIPHP